MRKKKIQHELNLAEEKFKEGKLSEALEILYSLEPLNNFTKNQKAMFFTLNTNNHIYLGNYPKAYEMADLGMQFANKIERCMEVVDVFLNMAFILRILGKEMESMNLLNESSEILQNLEKISEKDRKRRMGLIHLYKGQNFFSLGESKNSIEELKNAIDLLEKWGSQVNIAIAYAFCGGMYQIIGENNKALPLISKSQKICENNESLPFVLPHYLNNMISGGIYLMKGELQLAVEYTKKAVSLGRKYNNPSFLMEGLNNLGLIFGELGEWDPAIKCLKEALPIAENMENFPYVIGFSDSLFQIYVNMGDKTAAQQLFHKIEQYRDNAKENKKLNQIYQIDKAILMRMSKRTRDLGVAQEIFKNIIQEEVISIELTQAAILNLCEMLLDEYKDTKNIEALEEFSTLLKQLQKAAEKQHAYPILAETYLLEAKLSMINYDLKKSRHSLTKAQQIANRYGLILLAIKISNEHDKLIQNLEVWKQMKEENVSVPERLEKVEISDQILRMLNKKPVVIPETTPESPILLLVMTQSILRYLTRNGKLVKIFLAVFFQRSILSVSKSFRKA